MLNLWNNLKHILCPALSITLVLSFTSVAWADGNAVPGSPTGGTTNVTTDPLPLIVVGALVVFGGIILYDIVFHPYDPSKKKAADEKKDKAKDVEKTKAYVEKGDGEKLPGYSTEYDTMIGIGEGKQEVLQHTHMTKKTG